MNTSNYFSEVTDPRVTGRCLHLLSDILMIGLLSIITFFIAFLFNKYYITIISIGGILIISSIIYSNYSFKKRTKYEKNATELLTEEFNRKYPEEDD